MGFNSGFKGLTKNRPCQDWDPHRLLFSEHHVYLPEKRRLVLEFGHGPPSISEIKNKCSVTTPMRFVTSLVLTLVLTFSHLTLKLLVLIEDYSGSKFHINIFTEMLQMIETFLSNCSLAVKIIVQ
jgi:hypothetical protein